jgi:hypothetical protein
MSITFPFTDLEGLLPAEQIVQALDDNGDGEADEATWNGVLAAANGRLASCTGGEEIDEAQALWAVKLFAAEILYNRRGFSENRNPIYSQAKDAEERIRDLAQNGELSDEEAEAGAVTEDLHISGRSERLI